MAPLFPYVERLLFADPRFSAQPTGTSPKFVNMTVQALQEFEDTHGVKLEKITKVPLEGDGTIEHRVDK